MHKPLSLSRLSYRPRYSKLLASALAPERCASLVVVGSAFLGILGCGGDATTAPRLRTSSQAYWALQLNQHAVNLASQAPYNTIHLTAVPLTAAGTPLLGAGSVHFRTSDSSVTVDSVTGIVTAHFATQLGQPTPVVAVLTLQGVTLADTALIQVTDTVPQRALATFSMQPATGDSAKRSFDWIQKHGLAWPVSASDAGGNVLCNPSQCALQVYYTSSNPNITIGSATGNIQPNDTGQTILRATTWVYGVAKSDSVVFKVGYLLSYTNQMVVTTVSGVPTVMFASAPRQLVLGVGAIVKFQDLSPQQVDVVFDSTTGIDTAGCLSIQETFAHGAQTYAAPTGSGNVPPFGGDTTAVNGISFFQYDADVDLRCRWFRQAGVYRYHSTVFPSDTFTFTIK